MVTALQVLSIMVQTGKKLRNWPPRWTSSRNLLVNVKVSRREGWEQEPSIVSAIKEAESLPEGPGQGGGAALRHRED